MANELTDVEVGELVPFLRQRFPQALELFQTVMRRSSPAVVQPTAPVLVHPEVALLSTVEVSRDSAASPAALDSRALLSPAIAIPAPPSQKAAPVEHATKTRAAKKSRANTTRDTAPRESRTRSSSRSNNARANNRSRSPTLTVMSACHKGAAAAAISMEFDTSAPANSADTDNDGFIIVNHNKKRKTRGVSETSSRSDVTITNPTVHSGPPSKRSPPPLVIRDKSAWKDLAKEIPTKGIQIKEARDIRDGIKVMVQSSDDHRALTRFLGDRRVYYFTHALQDERRLRAVIRGLPKEIETSCILDDLKSQGFPAHEVHRMHRKDAAKTPLDLVLVVLDLSPEGKKIFNVEKVCNLSGLRVEAPHKKNGLSQCHRCQLYGHSARYCQSRPRCVKCLGDHGTSDCTRTRDSLEPPSCTLCRQTGHTANYGGCPAAPRPKRKVSKRNAVKPKPTPFVAAPPPMRNAWTGQLSSDDFPSLVTPTHAFNAPSSAVLHSQTAPSSHTLAEDLAIVTEFARNPPFDMRRVQELARILRQKRSPRIDLLLQMEYSDLLQILRSDG